MLEGRGYLLCFLLWLFINTIEIFGFLLFIYLFLNIYFSSTARQLGQSLEKIDRAKMLAPLVGIVLNLKNASLAPSHGVTYDMATVLAGVDISAAVVANFQYLLDYSWVTVNTFLVY